MADLSNRSQFAGNIQRYYRYLALQGFGFGLMLAVWVIYLQQRRGLSLAQAALVDVTFFVTVTLAEVPTGIVADRFGRKVSILIGAALLCVGTLAWAIAPSLPLIMIAYMVMAIGTTFLSGASEAFFYESLQVTGRADEYATLAGRAGATMVGALAFGSLASGLLATIDLILPLVVASGCYLVMLGIALTFKEPRTADQTAERLQPGYGEVLRESLNWMRAHPGLRYPIFYLSLVPLAALMMETLFLQPQALALGVPVAGIGAVMMVIQLVNVVGAAWSDRVPAWLGENRILYLAPFMIVLSLLLLATYQVLPALACIVVIGFVTAVMRPILLNHVQHQVSDDIRATLLSLQSLLATLLGAISQPTLGFIADRGGLPAAYLVLAGGLGLLLALLFWGSRGHFPQKAAAASTVSPAQ